jgi:hypothetical protein
MTRAEAIQVLARIFGDEIRYALVCLPALMIAACARVRDEDAAELLEAVTVLLGGTFALVETGEVRPEMGTVLT